MLGKSRINDKDLKTRSKAHQIGCAELAEKKNALFEVAKRVGRLRKKRREAKKHVARKKAEYVAVQKQVVPREWLRREADEDGRRRWKRPKTTEAGKRELEAAKAALQREEERLKTIARDLENMTAAYDAAKKELVELVDRARAHLKKQREDILGRPSFRDELEGLVAARDRQFRSLEHVLAQGEARYPLTPDRQQEGAAHVQALQAQIGDPANVADIALEDVDPNPRVGRVRERALEDLVLLDKKIERAMWVVRELDARRAAYRELKDAVQHAKGFWTYVERMENWHGRFLRLAESVTTVTRQWKGLTGDRARKQKSLTGSRDIALELGVGASVGVGDAVKLGELGLSIVVSGTLSHDDDRRLRAALSFKLVPNLKVEVSAAGAKLFELSAKLGFTVAHQAYAFVDAKHFAYYLAFRVANLVHFASKFSQYEHGHRAQLHQHIDLYSEDCKALLAEMMSEEAIEEMRTYLSEKPIVKAHRKRTGAPDVDLGFKSTFAGELTGSGSWQRTTFQRQRLLLDENAAEAQAAEKPQGDFWKYESRDPAASLYQSMGFLLDHHGAAPRRPEVATLRRAAKAEWLDRYHEREKRQRERKQQLQTHDANAQQIKQLRTDNARDRARREELEQRVKHLKRAKHSPDAEQSRKEAEQDIRAIDDRIARREKEIARLEKENEAMNLHRLPDVPGDAHWTLRDGETLDAFQQAIDRGAPGDTRHLAALAYRYRVIVKVHAAGRPGTRTIGSPPEDILKVERAVRTLHVLQEGEAPRARYHALLPSQGGAAPGPDARVHLRRTAYQSAAYDAALQTSRAQQQAQHPAAHRLLTEVRRGTTRSVSSGMSVASWASVGVTAGYTYLSANANLDNDGHYLNVQVDGGLFARTLDHDFATASKEARKEELEAKETLSAKEREELDDLKDDLAGPYDDTAAEAAHEEFEAWGKNETNKLKEEAGKLAKTLFGELSEHVAQGLLDAGANGLGKLGLSLNRAQRHVTFNFIWSEGGFRLQYVRWVYKQSSKLSASGTVPTGDGVDLKLSAELAWSKAVALQERLGVNTLTYVMTVFNGLKRRPDGDAQWRTFLQQNRAQLRTLFRNVAVQKDGKGGVRAEARAMEQQANENKDLWENSKWAALESEWLTDTAHPVKFVEACEAQRDRLKPDRTSRGHACFLQAPDTKSLEDKLTTLLWRASQVAEHENQIALPWRKKTVYLVPPKGRIRFEVAFNDAHQAFVAARMPQVGGRPETVKQLLQASEEDKAYFDTTLVDVLRNPALAKAKSMLPFYQNGFEIELVIRLPDGRALTLQARQPDGEEALKKVVFRMARKAKQATTRAQSRLPGREAKRREAARKEQAFYTLLKLHPALAKTRARGEGRGWKLGDKELTGKAWEQHARKTWDDFLRNAPSNWFEQVLDAIRGPFWGLPPATPPKAASARSYSGGIR